MAGVVVGRRSAAVEISRLRAENNVLRLFVERIEAEWRQPGHVTKAEVRLALDETAAALAVLEGRG